MFYLKDLRLLSVLSLYLVAGCTSTKFQNANPNIISIEKHWTDDDRNKGYVEARAYCSNLGKRARFTGEIPRSFLVSEYSNYNYICESENDNSQNPVTPNTASQQSAGSDNEKNQCLKMGFNDGSPDLANCTLKLRQFEEDAKHRADEYRMAKEEAEAERREREGLALMQLGLGMAAGAGSSSPSYRSAPIYNPPSPLIFMSPRGSVVCNFVGNIVSCM